jgi:hypothetical protein
MRHDDYCRRAANTHPSYPLITLSTRAQVESKRAQSSTLNAARRIIKREGVAGLYAGLDSALFGISVTNFVYYYCARHLLLIRHAVQWGTDSSQGTNGPAPSSKRPRSKPVALPRSSQPSSP